MKKLIVSANNTIEESCIPVVMPVVTTNNFICDLEVPRPKYYYGLKGNPSRDFLEQELALLDEADYALCFPSGMAAIMGIIVRLIKSGDHLICSNRTYSGTIQLLLEEARNRNFQVTFVDMLIVQNVRNAMRANTKIVLAEVISNPTTRVLNLKKITDIVSAYSETLLIVDNTLLTPCLMKPLNFGAHIVIHSVSKLLSGHGDVMMGVIVTRLKPVYELLKFYQCSMGIAASPFDCYMVSRSLKTLRLRIKAHCLGATTVAEFLNCHSAVESVLYPSLPNHPEHIQAKLQMHGFGAMVSFYLKSGSEEIHKFIKRLNVFKSTGGLGHIESMAFYGWTWFHKFPASTIGDDLNAFEDWTENFVRLSIGLEQPELLVLDLKQSLDKINH